MFFEGMCTFKEGFGRGKTPRISYIKNLGILESQLNIF
jgi:hypothetical protein